MRKERTCGTCVFNSKAGHACMRHAPNPSLDTPTGTVSRPFWPEIQPGWFCGEHMTEAEFEASREALLLRVTHEIHIPAQTEDAPMYGGWQLCAWCKRPVPNGMSCPCTKVTCDQG